MDLKLKRLLEQAQFTKYKGRGYDAAEVDDFLDRASAMAAKVEVQLTEALGRSGNTPGGEAAAPSGPSKEEVEAEIARRVQARIDEMPPPPESKSSPPVDEAAAGRAAEEAAEEARRTLVLAQRTADAAMREAREEAEQLLSKARDEAGSSVSDAEAHTQRLRADAEAEVGRKRNEAREDLANEIRELEQTREELRSDVHALERHVDLQRSKVTSAIGELQRVLDDPDGIQLTEAPEDRAEVPDLTPVDIPEEAPSTPVADDGPAASGQASEERDEPSSGSDEQQDPEAEESSSWFSSPPPTPRRGTETSSEQADVDPVAISDVDQERPSQDVSSSAPSESGPPTAPVGAVDLDLPAAEAQPDQADPSSTDDAFLAELRKAMADDEPLGPRDTTASAPADLFGDDRPRRFGRRR